MAKKTKVIEYLSIPYTHSDPFVRAYRFEVANKIAAALMLEGRIILSPISMSHPMSVYGLPGDWDFWQDYDEAYVKASGKILVVKLEGWKKSVGVKAEIKLAKKYKIPVSYIDPKKYLNGH